MSAWESMGKSDEWYTPKYIFDTLGCQFDTDVASPNDRSFCHVPATTFITKNSLELQWNGFVWCNPPFGGRNAIGSWLDKMSSHRNGIALTPDRTSCAWWQKAAKEADVILFIHGKIKFIKPDGSSGNSPSNGTTLFGYGEKAKNVIERADSLGIVLRKRHPISTIIIYENF